MASKEKISAKRADAMPRVIFVLQGGGALGAYHIGAYQALEEAGYLPDWVAGTSIGAINAAVIAGNQPGDRMQKLEELWNEISWAGDWGEHLSGESRRLYNMGSNMEALLFGQPNFFVPRFPSPYCAPAGTPGATSFYDTAPLRSTLELFVDFDIINSKKVRLSLGTTQVRTGSMKFFDNTCTKKGLTAEHVMASGSLPPGFPAVQIEGELYWDGGCVSNTPLEAILADDPGGSLLVFMIDLWDAHGPAPQTMDEVFWRQKQIQYASRTTQQIEATAKRRNLRHSLGLLASHLPDEALRIPAVQDALAQTSKAKMDIVHIIYHPGSDQISQSDAEFSRPSIAERRASGYADMTLALAKKPWLEPVPEHVGAVVHSIKGGEILSRIPTVKASLQLGEARFMP
ncbi:MAG: patatin-like phospholipase family protein [Syntrophobacteraceae bacterium]